MDQECIQIGNYLISKDVLDVLIPLVSSLVGILIGGAIAYISVRSSDNRKWEQEKKDKLSVERREAIAIALEWFNPFRDAMTKARLLTGSYLQGRIDKERLRTRWPDLISHPGLKDPPPRLQVWLRTDTYKRAFSIIGKLDNFVFEINRYPPTADEWANQFSQYSDYLFDLEKELEDLEKDLMEEYQQTFG